MGAYTTGIRADGYELQFYANDENLLTYRVGDAVEWSIDPEEVGSETLFDGIYYGYGSLADGTAAQGFAVIKGHGLIELVTEAEAGAGPVESQVARLREKFDLSERPEAEYRALFTEGAWQRHEAQRAKVMQELEQFLEGANTPEERLIKAIAFPLMVGINYQEVARTILSTPAP